MIAYIAMSLDGYIADVDGKIDWLESIEVPNLGEEYGKFYASVDTVLMGSRTYDQILTFDVEYPYLDKKNYILAFDKEKYADVTDKNFISIDEIPEEIKSEKTWVVGGAMVVNELMKRNLVNKFQISVMPIILGDGIRLFGDVSIDSLVLEEQKKFGNVVELTYRVNK